MAPSSGQFLRVISTKERVSRRRGRADRGQAAPQPCRRRDEEPGAGRELRAPVGAGLFPPCTPISSGVPGLHSNNRTAEQETGQKLGQKACFPFKRGTGAIKSSQLPLSGASSPLSLQKSPFSHRVCGGCVPASRPARIAGKWGCQAIPDLLLGGHSKGRDQTLPPRTCFPRREVGEQGARKKREHPARDASPRPILGGLFPLPPPRSPSCGMCVTGSSSDRKPGAGKEKAGVFRLNGHLSAW